MTRFRASSGFTLIATLLFLVVLAFLGVSSLGTVSLQERMASNLKEKERATEVAEVANRDAERFLAEFPPAGTLEEIPRADRNSGDDVWVLGWYVNPAHTTPPDASLSAFLNEENWVNASAFVGPPFDDSSYIGSGLRLGASAKYAALPQSITEEAAFDPYSLNPDDLALGKGVFYYRVTGRGVGGNETAVSIVQSMYLRRFK